LLDSIFDRFFWKTTTAREESTAYVIQGSTDGMDCDVVRVLSTDCDRGDTHSNASCETRWLELYSQKTVS